MSIIELNSFKKFYLLFFLIIIIFVIHAVYLNCIAEDAFITFRFAKNIANGHGFIWNIGETPVEGYTNFLWVVICALAMKIGFNVLLFSQIVGVLSSIGTIIFTYLFSIKILKLNRLCSLIPCLFLAISGPFATWASSGMETNIFGLFSIAGSYYFASYYIQKSKRYLFISSWFLFLATLTRPEGIIFFVLFIIISLIKLGRDFKKNSNLYFVASLFYIVPFMTYFIWRFSYYGYLLPNTFYAKTGGTVFQVLRGVKYSGSFYIYFITPLLLSIIFFLRKIKISFFLKKINSNLIKTHIGLSICFILCLVYTFYIIFIGGDYMAMYRFFVPILPFIYLIFGYINNSLFCFSNKYPRDLSFAKYFFIFAIAATLIHSLPIEKKIFPKPSGHHGNYRGVEIERWHSARLSLIGNFFDEYKKNTNESLLTGAIGAIAYCSNMKIYGFNGLVDTHIAHIEKKNLGKGFPGHEKEDILYSLSLKPTYIMFSRRLTKIPRVIISRKIYNVLPVIRKNYMPISIWLVDKINSKEGYLSFFKLK